MMRVIEARSSEVTQSGKSYNFIDYELKKEFPVNNLAQACCSSGTLFRFISINYFPYFFKIR